MSRFAQRGRMLQEQLLSLATRWSAFRGLLLVDAAGLPLASTLRSRSLEERLAGLASLGIAFLNRATVDLAIGHAHVLHLTAQDRQLLLVPVERDTYLMAVAEADASPTDLERQLLATARDLLAVPDSDRENDETFEQGHM